MKRTLTSFVMVCVSAFGLLLAGCGGGQSKAAQEPTTTVTGVAAAGAPIAGGIVSLKDSYDPAKEINTTTAADGSFAFDVKGLTAPFMLRITWSSGTASHQMYSLASGPATANINPLSNAAIAAAARVPDLALLYSQSDPMTFKTIAKDLPTAIDMLRAKLSPLFEQYKTAQNPVTDAFTADHTGMDKLFDDVVISVTNGTITVMNRAGGIIFSALVSDVASGIFKAENIPGTGTGASPAPAGAEDGALLYNSNCSGCHGTLAVTGKRGATAARIQSAINNNTGAMGSLSTLTTSQVQAIATALSSTTPTPAPAPVPTDGKTLYSTYCSSCHGSLSTSDVRGSSASEIQSEIKGTRSMNKLSGLTLIQIQAIAAALR